MASDSENARTYYHYACDSLGSITYVIAGNEFGNGDVKSRILCRYEYDAFGNTINAEETIANRYGFTGEMHDSITDMYYLRARYYAPDTGRFIQIDTYHGDGLNLYVYARNNPVKYVDPSGHESENSVAEINGSGITSKINKGLQNATIDEINQAKIQIEERIAGIKDVMTEGEKSRTTYGVARVKLEEGCYQNWIASAGKQGYVRPDIRMDDIVKKNKRPEGNSDNRFNDAEQTLMREANQSNAEIVAMAASRPMCPRCQEVARQNEIIDRMVTELK